MHKFLYQVIIQAEIGQYVQIKLFDKDEASDDENLGRWATKLIIRNQSILTSAISLHHTKFLKKIINFD